MYQILLTIEQKEATGHPLELLVVDGPKRGVLGSLSKDGVILVFVVHLLRGVQLVQHVLDELLQLGDALSERHKAYSD